MTRQELLSELISSLKITSLRLPSNIEISLIGTTLNITIKKGLTMNMQTDESAFEGWGICLKYNLPHLIEDIEIVWDTKSVDEDNLHYKRFLYRVWKFTNTFLWAKCSVYDFSKYNTEGWIINYPKIGATPTAENPEAKLEREYIKSHANDYDYIYNQLPVGLFNKEISQLTRETPGQNSQIDIWAIKGDTLYIFELKVDTNKSVGIITELMFYVNVMNDLIKGTIQFDERSEGVTIRDFDKFRAVIKAKAIEKIEGCFLTNNLHPLITSNVIDGINSCLTNISYNKKSIK